MEPPATHGLPPFRLDLPRRLPGRDGAPVPPSPRAFDILQVLVEARERVPTRRNAEQPPVPTGGCSGLLSQQDIAPRHQSTPGRNIVRQAVSPRS